MQVHSCEAVGGRDQDRRRRSVRPKSLPVHEEFGIEFSRPPGQQHFPYRSLLHTQQLRRRAQVWRQIDYRADIQIAVRPSIQSMSDVAGGMPGAWNEVSTVE